MIKKIFEKFIFQSKILKYKVERFDYLSYSPTIATILLTTILLFIVGILNLVQPKITIRSLTNNNFQFNENQPAFIMDTNGLVKTQKTNNQSQVLGTKINNEMIEIDGNQIITQLYYDQNLSEIKPEMSPMKNEIDKFTIKLPETSQFNPGEYTLKVEVKNNRKTYSKEQKFLWGNLLINSNQDSYAPGQTANFSIVVLNKENAAADANINLKITNPKSETRELSTRNGEIIFANQSNQRKTIEYQAKYQVFEEGEYQLQLSAEIQNEIYNIKKIFYVNKNANFIIEREGSSHLSPINNNKMSIKIESKKDFSGQIIEKVPASLTIVSQKNFSIEKNNSNQKIIWQVNLKAGETIKINYDFKYSNNSPSEKPNIYLLGPLEFKTSNENQTLYQEKSQWKIVLDYLAITQILPVFSLENIIEVKGIRSNMILAKIARGSKNELWLLDLQKKDQKNISFNASVASDFSIGVKNNFIFWLSEEKKILFAYNINKKDTRQKNISDFSPEVGKEVSVNFSDIPWEVKVKPDGFSFYSNNKETSSDDENPQAFEWFRKKYQLDNFLSKEQINNIGGSQSYE